MSTLVLVRHGQARPFEKDSDRLSELGERQSRALGEYWATRGVAFDEVYCGSLVRHRRTEECCREAYLAAGSSRWPVAVVNPGWNEYDADGVLHRLGPALADREEAFAKLRAEFEAMRGSPDRNRYFQRLLEALMERWLGGEIVDGVEPFAAYEARVRSALQAVLDGRGSRNVAVFTSGGPIGLCVQQALGAPIPTFLDVNWRVKNCSLTEFVFGRGRISIDSFNTISHLADPALISFR
jgi:broad specificity phosphatase PhoE